MVDPDRRRPTTTTDGRENSYNETRHSKLNPDTLYQDTNSEREYYITVYSINDKVVTEHKRAHKECSANLHIKTFSRLRHFE